MSRGPTIAIVGGGFCGAATAWHLASRLSPTAARVMVIEPREVLGAGLAYSTQDPAHRINVPATKMSLRTDDMADFSNWMARANTPDPDTASLSSGGSLFPQRSLFGAYVAARLQPLLASGMVTHLRTSARGVDLRDRDVVLNLTEGRQVTADALVIATTHPPPAPPSPLADLTDSPFLIANPFAPDALNDVGPDDPVLIVGTGLTSADMIASLDHRGHRGPITAISRHGYRSRPHGPAQATTSGDFAGNPAHTAREVLNRIRASVTEDAQAGLTWHAALDLARSQGPAIWGALDHTERTRLLRHLRTLWDVHRFRVAPQVDDVILRRIAESTLAFQAGRLVAAMPEDCHITVRWRPRGAATLKVGYYARVIVTTGPAHGAVIQSNPVLTSLAAAGALRPDPLGLGLHVDKQARALPLGRPDRPPIFVVGPLARGSVGELMGIPEVTAHAEMVAEQIADWIGKSQSPIRATG